jgi:hypothetical protein
MTSYARPTSNIPGTLSAPNVRFGSRPQYGGTSATSIDDYERDDDNLDARLRGGYEIGGELYTPTPTSSFGLWGLVRDTMQTKLAEFMAEHPFTSEEMGLTYDSEIDSLYLDVPAIPKDLNYQGYLAHLHNLDQLRSFGYTVPDEIVKKITRDNVWEATGELEDYVDEHIRPHLTPEQNKMIVSHRERYNQARENLIAAGVSLKASHDSSGLASEIAFFVLQLIPHSPLDVAIALTSGGVISKLGSNLLGRMVLDGTLGASLSALDTAQKNEVYGFYGLGEASVKDAAIAGALFGAVTGALLHTGGHLYSRLKGRKVAELGGIIADAPVENRAAFLGGVHDELLQKRNQYVDYSKRIMEATTPLEAQKMMVRGSTEPVVIPEDITHLKRKWNLDEQYKLLGRSVATADRSISGELLERAYERYQQVTAQGVRGGTKTADIARQGVRVTSEYRRVVSNRPSATELGRAKIATEIRSVSKLQQTLSELADPDLRQIVQSELEYVDKKVHASIITRFQEKRKTKQIFSSDQVRAEIRSFEAGRKSPAELKKMGAKPEHTAADLKRLADQASGSQKTALARQAEILEKTAAAYSDMIKATETEAGIFSLDLLHGSNPASAEKLLSMELSLRQQRPSSDVFAKWGIDGSDSNITKTIGHALKQDPFHPHRYEMLEEVTRTQYLRHIKNAFETRVFVDRYGVTPQQAKADMAVTDVMANLLGKEHIQTSDLFGAYNFYEGMQTIRDGKPYSKLSNLEKRQAVSHQVAYLDSAHGQAPTYFHHLVGKLHPIFQEANKRRINRSETLLRDTIAAMLGQEVEGDFARKIAAEARAALDREYVLRRQLGQDVNYTENYLPQTINLKKLSADPKAARQVMLETLDFETMGIIDRESQLKFVQDTVTELMTKDSLGNIRRHTSNRRVASKERSLTYKDAESYLRAMETYGIDVTDVPAMLERYFRDTSLTLARLEYFGNGRIINDLFQANSELLNRPDLLTTTKRVLDSTFKDYWNTESLPVAISVWYNVRNVAMSARMLATAIPSLLGDAFMTTAMSTQLGLSSTKAMLFRAKGLVKRLPPHEIQHMVGMMDTSQSYLSHKRFGDITVNSRTRGLLHGSAKVSGQEFVTHSAEFTWRVFLQNSMHNLRDKPMNQLPRQLQQQMKKYGVAAKHWDLIRQIDPVSVAGVPVLSPMEALQNQPPVTVKNALMKYINFINQTEMRAVTRVRPSQRAKLGTADPGTIGGALAQEAFTFKMSTTAEILNLVEVFGEVGLKEGVSLLGTAIGTGYVFGFMREALRDLQKGVTPDLHSSDFWQRVALNPMIPYASELLNIVFGEQSLSNFASGAGFTEDYILRTFHKLNKALEGKLEGDWEKTTSNARDATDTIVPLRSLPFFGLLGSRMVFDQIHLMFDPDAAIMLRRKSNKDAIEEDNFFLPPGKFPMKYQNRLRGAVRYSE